MQKRWRPWAICTLLAWNLKVGAISLDVNDVVSIKEAASTLAYGLMKYYTGNQTGNPATVGLLPAPYYWWEAGAVWGAMIEYWGYTNDSSYNTVVSQSLLSQASPTRDFMPVAQQSNEGNDDQVFWGLAAMSAVERQFPSPLSTSPQYLPLAAAVFDDLASRWDLTSCNGGLKWQILASNIGYDYKNTPSNGGLFHLAARLARYTGNQTYVDWAEKSWDWMSAVGLFDVRYNVFDGTDDLINCSRVDHTAWSYNAGMLLFGASVLANYTNSPVWQRRATGLLSSAASNFFTPFSNASNVMYEPACEKATACNTDQLSFKAYLARWMAASTHMTPYTTEAVMKLLRPSALAAARACSGGSDNRTCGTKWYVGGWDGTSGIGQQLAALEVVQGLLVNSTEPPAVASGVRISLATATSTVILPTEVPTLKDGDGKLASTAGILEQFQNKMLWFAWLILFAGILIV